MATNSNTVRRPATVRVARWSAEHPWRVIALWLVFVAGCVAVGQLSGLKTVTDLDTGVGQSGRAEQIMHDAGLTDPVAENVLITARSGTLSPRAAAPAASAVTARMTALPEVASVAAPVTSRDGTAVLVEVKMAGDPETADDRVPALLDATADVARNYPQLRIEEVGPASLNKGVNDEVSHDLGLAGEYSLPVTLLILLVVFGAIVAAGVPVLLALSAVISAIGLSAVASHVLPDSGTTSSMILLMGMAVGVDYSLFYVKRVREEREHGLSNLDAIELAAET